MCIFVKFRKRIETDLLYDKNNHIPRYFTLIVQTLLRSLLYILHIMYILFGMPHKF